jgi:hypothetical protein
MNSPMMAPISENGTPTLRAETIHGEAAGRFTLRKIWRSLAPITRAISR